MKALLKVQDYNLVAIPYSEDYVSIIKRLIVS